jgi:hypothetical protein
MRWVELLNDYDCEIKYNPDKANVVADALSRKERVKPLRTRATSITIQTSLKNPIIGAQMEALKDENSLAELLRNMREVLTVETDGAYYFMGRIWIPVFDVLRKVIMDESHRSRYSIHPKSDKMYQD